MSQPKREHCKKGHKLSPSNTYVHERTGNRRCKICKRESELKWNEIRKAERKKIIKKKDAGDDEWMN